MTVMVYPWVVYTGWYDQKCVWPLTVTLTEGGIGIFSFAVLAFFRLVFPFFWLWCLLRFADFQFFGIWFSVFAKNTNTFLDLISDVVFGLSYLTYLGSGFSSIWAAITGLHWSWIATRCKCYQEECMTNQLKYHRDP